MKFKILLTTLILLCTGCSSAIRDQSLVVSESDNWLISSGFAQHSCDNSEINAGSISLSRLFISGPVIPLIPTKHTYPGYITVTASNSTSCPTINIYGTDHSSTKSHQYKTTITCEYKLGNLDHKQPVQLIFKHPEKACSISPLNFAPTTDWGYCLVCSA